jgi:hypothetical protein
MISKIYNAASIFLKTGVVLKELHDFLWRSYNFLVQHQGRFPIKFGLLPQKGSSKPPDRALFGVLTPNESYDYRKKFEDMILK